MHPQHCLGDVNIKIITQILAMDTEQCFNTIINHSQSSKIEGGRPMEDLNFMIFHQSFPQLTRELLTSIRAEVAAMSKDALIAEEIERRKASPLCREEEGKMQARVEQIYEGGHLHYGEILRRLFLQLNAKIDSRIVTLVVEMSRAIGWVSMGTVTQRKIYLSLGGKGCLIRFLDIVTDARRPAITVVANVAGFYCIALPHRYRLVAKLQEQFAAAPTFGEVS